MNIPRKKERQRIQGKMIIKIVTELSVFSDGYKISANRTSTFTSSIKSTRTGYWITRERKRIQWISIWRSKHCRVQLWSWVLGTKTRLSVFTCKDQKKLTGYREMWRHFGHPQYKIVKKKRKNKLCKAVKRIWQE